MVPLRQRALKLRLQGYSFNEINKELGVPKSTLSGWFAGITLSADARSRIQQRVKQGTLNGIVKRNKLQTHIARQRARQIRKEAKRQVSVIKREDLLMLGAALYWAEGYKKPIIRNGLEITSHSISFVNSDPVMVKVFLCFLKEILEVPLEKIALYMRLYPHINPQTARQYWATVTGLSMASFRKPTNLISLSSKNKRPFDRLPFGTLQIHVADTKKFHQLMGLIEGVKNQF